VKHPILGDPIYGTAFQASNAYLEEELSDEDRMVEMGASRLMLHAQSLSFPYGAHYHIESKVDFSGMRNLICSKDKRVFNIVS
jgi:23S rRNA pseudouridine1911/1915/1917 synthase